MWLPDCLPATYPTHTCRYSPLYGIPLGTRGRCANIPVRGIVVHCIGEEADSYLAERCALPRNHRTRGRNHHDSLHWLITREGHVICMVDEEDIAWGFGDTEPCPREPWAALNNLTPAQYDCAVVHIGIETSPRTGLYWQHCSCAEPTPYKAINEVLPRLIAAIARRHNFPINRDTVITHTELHPCVSECEEIQSEHLICAARNYCERPLLFTEEDYPTIPQGEQLVWVLGITNTGRLVKIRRSDL